MLKELFVSMRPKQWYKNFIIFVAIVFSFNLLEFYLWFEVILAFVVFCMLSGVSYLVNDIIDRKRDRLHPKKMYRPIASGKLNVFYAKIAVLLFLFLSLFLSYFINFIFLFVAVVFIFLNLSYTFYLKRFVLVDVLAIASGFVIRAVAGAVAINVDISPWLVICVFLLALFLGLGKRRHELVLMGVASKSHRAILENYTRYMLDQMISVVTGALIISYMFYTFMAADRLIMVTIPVVIYALFRYLFLVNLRDAGGEPQMIFRDRGMVASLVVWAFLVVVILYKIPEVFLDFFRVNLPAFFS